MMCVVTDANIYFHLERILKGINMTASSLAVCGQLNKADQGKESEMKALHFVPIFAPSVCEWPSCLYGTVSVYLIAFQTTINDHLALLNSGRPLN